MRRDTYHWWVICEIKVRLDVNIQESSSTTIHVETETFQEDKIIENQIEEIEDVDEEIILNDPSGSFLEANDAVVSNEKKDDEETEEDEDEEDFEN